MAMHNRSISAAFLSVVMVAPAMAEENAPAVSAPNLKVDAAAGALGGGPALLGGVTATVPLGHNFGVQLDGAIGNADNDQRGGVAGHVFYRNPNQMLLGVTTMWSNIAGPYENIDSNIRRAGVETEFYLGDFSILPSAGLQNSHGDTTGYANLGAIYYGTDNLALGASLSGSSSSRAVQAGVEYRPDNWTSMSYIFDMGVGTEGPPFFLGGVRFSFGAPSRTLKDRDRYDDPGNIVTYMNTASSAAIAAQNAQNAQNTQAFRARPVTASSGGGGGGGGNC